MRTEREVEELIELAREYCSFEAPCARQSTRQLPAKDEVSAAEAGAISESWSC